MFPCPYSYLRSNLGQSLENFQINFFLSKSFLNIQDFPRLKLDYHIGKAEFYMEAAEHASWDLSNKGQGPEDKLIWKKNQPDY